MRTEESTATEARTNNRRVKQAAEAAALLLFLRRNKVLAAAAGLSLIATASLLEKDLREGLAIARAQSQQSATERIRDELYSMGIVLTGVLTSNISRVGRNAARAQFYSRRFATDWLSAARGDDPIATANAATNARLATLGLTEGAAAFNERRHELARRFPHLMRMWDAVNDKRTCERCRSADGTIVGVNERFPLGEPGSVHPRCLCTWHLLTVDEIR